MRFAVLGSAGLIGAHLCAHLREHGHHVVEQDLLSTPAVDLRYHIDRQEVDLTFVLAFDVGGSKYLARHQGAFEFIDGNIQLMHNVFTHLHQASTPFIFASSQMSNMLTSPYGVLKRIGEFYSATLGGITVRFWNVYGKEAEHSPDKFHVITDFLHQAQTQRHIAMLTDGRERRQFLNVNDCVDGLRVLAENYAHLDPFLPYDLTSFQWTSIAELADLVAGLYPGTTVTAGSSPDVTQPMENEPTDHILRYWNPTTTLAKGVHKLADI